MRRWGRSALVYFGARAVLQVLFFIAMFCALMIFPPSPDAKVHPLADGVLGLFLMVLSLVFAFKSHDCDTLSTTMNACRWLGALLLVSSVVFVFASPFMA